MKNRKDGQTDGNKFLDASFTHIRINLTIGIIAIIIYFIVFDRKLNYVYGLLMLIALLLGVHFFIKYTKGNKKKVK